MGHLANIRRPSRACRILDCDFDAVSKEQTLDWVDDQIASGRRGTIFTVNVAILMMMRSMPLLRRFADQASLLVADGMPLVWVSKARENPLPERVTGCELVDEVCARAAHAGHRVYFMGAKRGTIEAAVARLQIKYPDLRVAGVADGYFDDAQAPERAAAIRESGAQILFVGMGVPKQERFLLDHFDALGVNVAIPVGGSFEVVAGVRKRAPKLVQKAGLEWCFRLIQEPRRLLGRYLVTNTQFLSLLAAELLTQPRARRALRHAIGQWRRHRPRRLAASK